MNRPTDELVRQLSTEVRPVRRLAPPAIRLALWFLAALVPGVYAIVLAVRYQCGGHLRDPLSFVALALTLAGVPLCAYAALCAAVPGEERRGTMYRASVRLAVLIAIVLAAGALWGAFRGEALPLGTAGHCARSIVVFGAVPGVALLVLLARALPLDRPRAGLLALLAWGLCGAAAVQLLCPDTGAMHLLVGHWGAVAGLGLAGLCVGAALVRAARRSHSRS